MAEISDLILEGLSGFQFISHNPTLKPQHLTQSKQWSMVVIRDSGGLSELSVFPPVNHENLHIPSQQNHNQEHPLPQSTYSPPSEVTEVVPASSHRGYAEWFGFGIHVLRAKMTELASLLGFRIGGGVGGAVRRILRVVGVAAVVISWWLCRRARLREKVDHLERVIEEKDEKIAQLLHQIAQMNQLLIERHKAVTM